MWYARIYNAKDFVLGVLLVNFFNDSTWNIYDLNDYFVVKAVQIYFMELFLMALLFFDVCVLY